MRCNTSLGATGQARRWSSVFASGNSEQEIRKKMLIRNKVVASQERHEIVIKGYCICSPFLLT
jgi:predicted nucleic acid-binding Zn finger protein